jgi:hypothetical protein
LKNKKRKVKKKNEGMEVQRAKKEHEHNGKQVIFPRDTYLFIPDDFAMAETTTIFL